jgi:hypothetical protein
MTGSVDSRFSPEAPPVHGESSLPALPLLAWLAIAGGALATVAVVGFIAWWFIDAAMAQAALDEEIAWRRARGEPVYLEEMAPEVSPEALARGERVMEIARRFEAWRREGENAKLVEQIAVGSDLVTVDIAPFGQLLERWRAERTEILAIARRGEVQIPFDYQAGRWWEVELLPHNEVRALTILFTAQYDQCAAADDRSGALAAVHELFEHAELLRHASFASGLLQRLGRLDLSLGYLADLLGRFELSDAELAAIDVRLAALEPTVLCRDALQMEIGSALSTMRDLGDMPVEKGKVGDFDILGRMQTSARHGQALLLRHTRGTLDRADEPLRGDDEESSENPWIALEALEDSGFAGFLTPSLYRMRAATRRTRQNVVAARIAIEILRQRRERPDLKPEELSLARLNLPHPLLSRFDGAPVSLHWDERTIQIGDKAEDLSLPRPFRIVFRSPQEIARERRLAAALSRLEEAGATTESDPPRYALDYDPAELTPVVIDLPADATDDLRELAASLYDERFTSSESHVLFINMRWPVAQFGRRPEDRKAPSPSP